MSLTDKELLEIFASEAQEYIDKLYDIVNKVSRGEASKDDINELLRILHSLKGNSATLGFTRLSEFVHRAEDVLTILRDKGTTKVDEVVAQKLMLLVDRIEKVVNHIVEHGNDDVELGDAYGLLEEIKNSLETGSSPTLEEILRSAAEEIGRGEQEDKGTTTPEAREAVGEGGIELSEEEMRRCAEALARGLYLYRIDLYLIPGNPMNMFRFLQALQKIGEVGEIITTVPRSADEVKPDTSHVVVVAAIRKLEDLDEALKELQDIERYTTARLNPEDLGITQEMIEEARERAVDRLAEIESLLKKVEEAGGEESTAEAATKRIEEIRVSVKTLDQLFNLVGELVLIKSRIMALTARYDSPGLREALATFDRLVNELQDEVMRLRLVPLDYIFKRLPRIVSELSQRYGKSVDLYYEGSEIAIDRKILEKISEPLYKLIEIAIRDSVENPDERRRKGKPPVATIRVYAYREGNRVALVVEDDGRGLDPEEVRSRAVELGLIPSSTAEKLSRDEALMLVTLPGFSLKNGAFSGLDVVKQEIEAIGGSFEIKSVVDMETKYVMHLPVSMATLKALLVRVGDNVYAIPVSSVVTTLSLSNVEKVGGTTVILYQGKPLPIHSLAALLGLDRGEGKYVIVVEKRGRNTGLLVDEIIGQENIVIKPLGTLLKEIRGLLGATILGDGSVCLILDPLSLIP